MKTFALFCVLIAATGLNAQGLTEEQKVKAKQYAVDCMKETGVTTDLLAEAKKGNFPEDEGSKKFAYCFFGKAGIVDAEGHLNVEVALQKLPSGIDKVTAEKVLNDCKSKTGSDPVDSTYQAFKCYHSSVNQHVAV